MTELMKQRREDTLVSVPEEAASRLLHKASTPIESSEIPLVHLQPGFGEMYKGLKRLLQDTAFLEAVAEQGLDGE
jgi:hypothetical protein